MILSDDVAGHIYFTSKFEPRYIPNQKRDGRAEYFIVFFFQNKLHHVYNIKILLLFVKIILKVERDIILTQGKCM